MAVREGNKFPFRDDDGNIVYVDFDTMMEMDAQGFLMIGKTLCRRARDLEPKTTRRQSLPNATVARVSDSLGFIDEGLDDMRAHLKESGVHGVEFKPDPQCEGFQQVHFSSEKAHQDYVASRGCYDKNSKNGSGAILSSLDLENAKELVKREHASPSLEGITNDQ